MLALQESFSDPQVVAREMVSRDNGVLQFAPPQKMSDYTFEIERPAPDAGQHADEILREAGYASADIDMFRVARVI